MAAPHKALKFCEEHFESMNISRGSKGFFVAILFVKQWKITKKDV